MNFRKEKQMNARQLIKFLGVIEKLKCNTRHSWTSSGRQESVAEHSWRLAVMAMLCADEYPHIDANKLIKMCLIHDFGEAVTGDVPSFLKTDENERDEASAISSLLAMLPDGTAEELRELFCEMDAMKSDEARLCKALDNMEGVLSHNEAPLSTWIPLERELNLTYGEDKAEFSPWTKQFRDLLRADSIRKLETE